MAQRVFVIGAGWFGAHLGTRLSEFGCETELADKTSDRVEELVQDGFHAVEMDAGDQDALKEAGVQEADAEVVSIGAHMQGSILTTPLLKELKVKQLICRPLDTRHATVLEKLGAGLVALPTRDLAYRLAKRLRESVHCDRQQSCDDHQLAQIRIGPPLDGKTLADAAMRERHRGNIVLLTRTAANGETEAIEPTPDRTLLRGDLLFEAGWRENLNRFEHECGEQPAAT